MPSPKDKSSDDDPNPTPLPELTGKWLYGLVIPLHRPGIGYKCTICDEKIYDSSYLRLSCRCDVKYHIRCFDQWYTKSPTCVACRGECCGRRFNRENLRSIIGNILRKKSSIMEDKSVEYYHLPSMKNHHYATKYRRIQELEHLRTKYLEVLNKTCPPLTPPPKVRRRIKSPYDIDLFFKWGNLRSPITPSYRWA